MHLWLPQASTALWDAPRADGAARARCRGPTTLGRPGRPPAARLARPGRPRAAARRSATAARARPRRPTPPPARHAARLAPARPARQRRARRRRARRAAPAGDRSVQVHACHGAARQVDVLREVLVGLLEDDPTLEPRDILVMCPDIESYAPLISAGVRARRRRRRRARATPAHQLRVRLADRVAGGHQPAARGRRRARRARGRPAHRHPGARPGRRRPGARPLRARRRRPRAGRPLGRRVRHPLGATTPRTARTFGLAGSTPTPGASGMRRVLLGAAMSGHEPPLRRRHACRSTTSATATSSWPAGSPSSSSGCTPSPGAPSAAHDRRGVDLGARRRRCTRSTSTALGRRLAAGAVRPRDRPASPPASSGGDAPRCGTPTCGPCSQHRLRRPADALQLPHRHPHRLHDGADALGAAPGRLPGRARRRGVPADRLRRRRRRAGPPTPHRRARPALARTGSCSSTRSLAATETLVVTYTGRGEHTGAERPPAVPLGELLDALDRTAAEPVRDHGARRTTRSSPSTRPTSCPGASAAPSRSPSTAPRSPGRWRRGAPRIEVRELVPAAAAGARPAAGDVALADLHDFFKHPVRGFFRAGCGSPTPYDADEAKDAIPITLDGLEQWAVGDRLRARRARPAPTRQTGDGGRAAARPAAARRARRRRAHRRSSQKVRPLVDPRPGAAHRARPRSLDVDIDLGDRRADRHRRRRLGQQPRRGHLLQPRRQAPAGRVDRRARAGGRATPTRTGRPTPSASTAPAGRSR